MKNAIQQYRYIFFKDEKINRRVFIQGDPGIGKTTFLTKLALDWCDKASSQKPDHKATFSDVDTLNDFQFLFHISLRDAMGQREVVEMIKTQIIDIIYMGDKREVIFKLLHQILERETCIITMDGLNEWTDPLHKYVSPLIANCTKCVSLISTRPWVMADERIKDSEIDRHFEIKGITDPKELTNNILISLHSAKQKTQTDFIEYVKERQLMQLLTTPWLQTMLINLWIHDSDFKGSLCEINCILLDLRFKKGNAEEGYFRKGTSFPCLSNTSFIEPQREILNALAKAAFHFTFSSEKSLLFSKREILEFMSKEQFQFCLDAGLLTVLYNSSASLSSPQMCFQHETIQEFLAALHIAHSKTDAIENELSKNKYNVLEMSQIIVYLCGLNCETANRLIARLTDEDFLNDTNRALRRYIRHFDTKLMAAFNTDYKTIRIIRNSESYEKDQNSHFLTLAFLFQRMMIAGFMEAKASGQKDICLECKDFTFNTYLNESESNALHLLLIGNVSNVRTLILESNAIKSSELLTVLQQSRNCLQRVKARVTPEVHQAFCDLKLKEVHFIGILNVSSISDVLASLTNLTYLNIEDSTLNEEIQIPVKLKYLDLTKIICTSVFLQRILVKLSFLKRSLVVLQMCDVNVTDCSTSIFQSELLPIDMSNILVDVKHGSNDLYGLLRCTPIVNMSLLTFDDTIVASDILPTFSKLRTLTLSGTYVGRCALKLPESLQIIGTAVAECSSEWLISLLTNLSVLEHTVTCIFVNLVVQSIDKTCGADSNTTITDLRSELLACDMSNIKIIVENVGQELFEIFRDTSINTLQLRTAECLSHSSEILPTLRSLEKLTLCGVYIGLCSFKLPASLQYIGLEEGECSSEWLISLLINLSSLDHTISCAFSSFVLNSVDESCCADPNMHLSDLGSKLLSCDMSNIELMVENGRKELFEIFRCTSIGYMYLRNADCVSQTSDILQTLSNLEKLLISGTYIGHCSLNLPASLQSINLVECICSSEWLSSLVIKLSAFSNPVVCQLWNVEVQSSVDIRVADIQVSDLRSTLLSCDLSNIEIVVTNGSKELFEIFHDTSLGILDLRTADCLSQTSDILPTLSKLEKLHFWGTYTGRFDLQLPASLHCVYLQTGECSSDWLCSLLIMLSTLNHPVKCELRDFIVQSRGADCGADSNIPVCDLRSKLVSCELSNVEILVNNGSVELFEIFRDTSIGTLDLRTADCVSQTSDILPTLSNLKNLHLWGTYTGRCALQLPSSLHGITLETGECSSEWLCSLLIKLSALDTCVHCTLWNFVVQSRIEYCSADSNIHVSDLHSELLLCDMSTVNITVKQGSKELFEIFHDTSVQILDLRTADCISQISDILSTLSKLKDLYLWGTYIGHFAIELPASLECISLVEFNCSYEWLYSLLINLSTLNHPVVCRLLKVVLSSSVEECGAFIQLSDLRSILLSCDLSHIEIVVTNGREELFEIFRDTSIWILDLRTADCISQTSDILPTLSKLEHLHLRGTYTGRFDFQLPASLYGAYLQEGECSPDWLCGLLIMLSALDHPVKCELWHFVLQSHGANCGAESNTPVCELHSNLVLCDLSNVEILVEDGSEELFEIFRDTSIGILDLRNDECISQISDILNTLRNLKKLYLRGIYMDRCDFHLPESLQCISLVTGECSPEWLCSLLIKLSALDHHVECQLWDFVVISRGENSGSDSKKHVSDYRLKLLSCDMSKIEIVVNNGSNELFELFRNTSIGTLDIRNADCISQTSDILPSLSKLEKLHLWGTYTGRLSFQLPASLQCIILETGECSYEWLCSLFINLSALDHHVECRMLNFALERILVL
ncbi:uncharacterized protein LOC127843769 isoform X1 [Dreissena polymorpha]|uniref:NACHT domain-containing protein n=1 Tax=Dreissena polymorpha TaxID=45954 RepID=A0A9D4DZB2_DREPO|nr:uncharacterized protein LOC127843769 isoform X1 [Dreissena polymorpha]KAH3770859.1 hypothetical protein DPMN_172156 [Dreissena polymorpha]